MKNTSLKNKFVVALLLATVGHVGIATAFSMGGSTTKIRKTGSSTPTPPPPGAFAVSRSGALDAEASATDVWTVTCPAATTKWLETKVIDTDSSTAPLVSVQTIKGIKATNSTDPSDGDATYSPLVKTTGSAGTFYVLVNKNSEGAELYTISIECKDSNNGSLSTSVGPDPSQNN